MQMPNYLREKLYNNCNTECYIFTKEYYFASNKYSTVSFGIELINNILIESIIIYMKEKGNDFSKKRKL